LAVATRTAGEPACGVIGGGRGGLRRHVMLGRLGRRSTGQAQHGRRVFGLATARAAALAGHEVVVADGAHGIVPGLSSRNREVIHTGRYYPTRSNRASHCPRVRRMIS